MAGPVLAETCRFHARGVFLDITSNERTNEGDDGDAPTAARHALLLRVMTDRPSVPVLGELWLALMSLIEASWVTTLFNNIHRCAATK